jgi:PilZ domain
VSTQTDIKVSLKNILCEHMEKRSSTLFIERSLDIVNESADTKESFIAAADRIHKRIALFIDTDLAQKVYDDLVAFIENTASPKGIQRKYRRVPFEEKIVVIYNGTLRELISGNLSERGMFIKTGDPFPVQSELEIRLPRGLGRVINLRGVVRSVMQGSASVGQLDKIPGMMIEFLGIDKATAEILRGVVEAHS